MPRRVLLVSFLLACVALPRASADEPFDPRDHRRLFAVRDTNAARHAIAEVRLALSRGQTLRALRAAQRVLDEMTNDFFLEVESSTIESVLWRSAPEVVREMLEGLSTEQRATYEEMTLPRAAPLLNSSLRQRNERGLREVLRRYGASTAGVQAARLLAEIALEAGRWRDAARYVQEGLRFAPRDAGLWVRLIDALAASGDRRTLANLQPPADVTYPTPEGPAPLPAHRDAALARMKEASGPTGWPMWGGVPARDGRLLEEPPMPNQLRWREATDLRERRQDRVQYRFGRGAGPAVFREMLATFRPLHPVVDERTVYVSDGRSVRAYDVYSGRLVWIFDARTHPDLPLAMPGVIAPGRTSLERAFSPVVAGDLVIATVEVARLYEAEHLQGVEISSYLPRRMLVALDKRTGAVRWHTYQATRDRLGPGGLSIISVPAVAEGLVLVVGSVHRNQHNVSFLAYDLRTGALRWQRPLGFGQQELNLFGAPVKELSASPVAVADGVAYASTGLGFVAAVDIRSGIPRWLASYEIIPIAKVQLWYEAPLRTPKMAPAPPVVHGDTLVVAPTDGSHVYAFDRRTGRLRWREPYLTDRIAYDVTGHFLGVLDDGRRDVVLLTDHALRARDLKTGRTVWEGRFDPEVDPVIGRGAVAGSEVLVPTVKGLQRFALRGDGAYRGTVPWPEDAVPGNLLPLGRVLIVTSRQDLQWFYDWAAIERDVQRRRQERPDDPTILLEAGEMYLRGGGETERARKAFHEALDVARKSSPEHVERAVRGLYMTWIHEGRQAEGLPEKAVAAYEKALAYAQSPEDHVQARLRIHRALADDPQGRIRNLTAMVETAGDAVAVFDDDEGEVPARAAALFLLAEEYMDAGRPTEAVNALQRVLREERDAEFPDGLGHERARRLIADILEAEGRLPYRRQEEEARRLLARASHERSTALLERLLNEYPNAAVVPEALIERGRSLLAEGRATVAARYLRRMLAEAPAHPLAPAALAGLVQAYRAWGALGAARFALAQIEGRYAHDRFRWDGRTWSGAAFAEAERPLLGSRKPQGPVPTLRAPLREVGFEPVGEDEYARPVQVALDETGSGEPDPCPVALMMRGRTLVAIDLARGRVAWDAPTGHCQRAVYAEGALVVAVSRELKGLDAETGEELWKLEHDASVREMQVAHGQVFVLLQDISGLAGRHRLIALDAFRGHELWSVDLGREEYRRLTPWRDQVLLQHIPLRERRTINALLIFDGFSGARRGNLTVPMQIERDPAIADSLYCVAGRAGTSSQRMLAAFDLETGRTKWQRPLVGQSAVTGLVVEGRRLLVLRADGSLVTYGARDGTAMHRTRIFVGDVGRASPFPGTDLLVDPRRITLFPWVRRPTLSVVTYDRRTGKLAWEAPYDTDVHPAKAALLRRGGLICSMISYPRDGVQNILIRLLHADTGKLLQEIEPEGLSRANWIPSLVEGYGTLVIFGKTGASIFRSAEAGDGR